MDTFCRKNRWALFLVFSFSLFQSTFAHSSLKDRMEFLGSFFKDPYKIGSITPSSVYLAKEITKSIEENKNDRKLRILEVGAGTGVFTEAVIKNLGDSNYVFDVIEIDENLSLLLKKNFEKEIENGKVNIICSSILDWNPEYSYDYIVSGLPFNYFDCEAVKEILNKYESMINNGGLISYFEYFGMSKLKPYFLRGDRKKDFLEMLSIICEFKEKFQVEAKFVFRNILPAVVYHLKGKEDDPNKKICYNEPASSNESNNKEINLKEQNVREGCKEEF